MYDVIIIGGGTAGCACAWNSAKLGLKTLLIEQENYLGGTMTASLVVPVMNSGQNQINTDFYNSLIHKMKKCHAQVTYQSNDGWFNPIKLKSVLYEMLRDAGVKILFNTKIDDIKCKNSIVLNLKIRIPKLLSVYNSSIRFRKYFRHINRKKYTAKIYTYNNGFKGISRNTLAIHTHNINALITTLSVSIEASYFVDTTGDLNFCHEIGCQFLENKLDLPPVSLRFIMSGIDLRKFSDQLLELDNDKDVTTVENIDGDVHLSTAYTWDSGKDWALALFFDDAVKKNILKDEDRNYFQVFTVAGMPNSLAFNCPRIMKNIDPLDKNDLVKAYNVGLAMIERICNFCKKYFRGFENAYVFRIADKVGVRSSRRLKGRYVYTIEDLRCGKKFNNPAVISNYPVDIHTREKNSSILTNYGEYQLPIESLISCDYENLYVAGRGLSADEYAQGALRVQASCFSMGEAVAKDIFSKICRNL